jgi:flagellar basal body-associated protein FliL
VNPFTIIVSIILVITILVGGYMFWVSNKKSKLKEQIHDLETLELGPPQPNGASSHAPPVPH